MYSISEEGGRRREVLYEFVNNISIVSVLVLQHSFGGCL
jgi:hypothetical protein